MKGFWNQFCGWKGWKRLFPLPLGWELMLFLVCLLTAAMGVYMLRRANREIKTLQEKTHGESFL